MEKYLMRSFALKFIPGDKDAPEVCIHRKLQSLKSDENHTVPIFDTWDLEEPKGTVIITGLCGFNISIHRDLEPFFLYVAKQLIEAVIFMHENGVAHNGTNMDSVVVNSKGQLTFVDFGSAVSIENEDTEAKVKLINKDTSMCGELLMFMSEMAGLGSRFRDDERPKLADLLGISEKLVKNEVELEKALQSINELDSSSTKK